MTERLRGQWALVTGAGRGIGRAIALELAGHGCSVALAARSQDQLLQVADECRAHGAPETSVHGVDLTDAGQVEELAQRLLGERGHVDVLVNNAGLGVPGTPTEGEPDEWDRMMALNLSAPMRLTRRLSPAMVEREQGTIINIGSIAAIEGMTGSGAYAAAKHGLRGWSLSCYRNLRGYGIKVMLVNPAFVSTELVSGRQGVRFDRMMEPTDVAQAAMLAVTTSPMCCPEEITLRLTRYAYE
jgi:short-subunit dehydrogenase